MGMAVFKRKWAYHFWTVFVQSILLIGVAYLTFYFKLSSFQDRIMIAITIIIMVNHTLTDNYIPRDPKTAIPINPRIKGKKAQGDDEEESENDQIDVFGENPNWEPNWVMAYKINLAGQVLNIVIFLMFNIVFWSVALNHFYLSTGLTTDEMDMDEMMGGKSMDEEMSGKSLDMEMGAKILDAAEIAHH